MPDATSSDDLAAVAVKLPEPPPEREVPTVAQMTGDGFDPEDTGVTNPNIQRGKPVVLHR